MQIKVLLADDHKIVLQGIRALLGDMKNVEIVGEAKDGLEAVHLVHKLHPDLLIMDIAMPNLNGIDATRKIVAENPKTKVIALSMHSEWAYVASMLEAGASGYLLKECTYDELQCAIEVVFQHKIYISEGIKGSFKNNLEHNPFENLDDESIRS